MQFLQIKRANGRTAYVNLERVIYVAYDETRQSFTFYFDGPERSVQAHPDETEKIKRVIEQHQV